MIPKRLLVACFVVTLIGSELGAMTQATEKEDRLALDFYGVRPGDTTVQELIQLDNWGLPAKTTQGPGGVQYLHYRIGRWDPVIVTELQDMVLAIDAAPPRGANPEKLAKILRLGRLKPGEPPKIESKLSPPVPTTWSSLDCSEGLVLIFTNQTETRTQVARVRFYDSLPPRPSFIGMGIREPSSERVKQLKITGKVLEVSTVTPDSAASKAGVLAGDLISELSGKPVGTPAEFIASIQELPTGSIQKLNIKREDRGLTTELVLKLETGSMPLKRSYFERGRSHAGDKRLDAAIRDFSRVLKLDPKLAVAHSNRGLCFFRKGNLETAIADFNEAVRLDPSSPQFRLYRGQTYGKRQQFEEALLDFNEVIRMAPRSADAFRYRSVTYRNLGQVDKADADLRTAKELAGDSGPPARVAKGAADDSKPRDRDGILAIDKQLQQQPLDQRTAKIRELHQNAMDLLKTGKVESAIAKFWNGRQLLVEKTIPTRVWVRLSFEVTDGDRELARYSSFVGQLNVKDYQQSFAGVRIRRVLPGSQAAKSGLLPGQRILKIGNQSVNRFEDVESTLATANAKGPTLLLIRDGSGENRFVTVKH